MPGQRKGRFAKTARELIESEHDKEAQAARENQQILIYLFVCLIIVSAWVLGTLHVSFLWVFFLVLLTFAVWYGKVLKLTEEHIKNKELQVHRKRALRQSETAEWLNFVINRWWVFSSNTISDLIKRKLDPVLLDIKPSFLDSIELHSFSLGEKTPFIKYIHVYEFVDGGPGGKTPMSWSNVVQPPPGLVQAQQYQVVMETDIGLNCEDFKMIFRTHMGGKWVGMNLDLAVEKLNISGKMQFVVHLDMDTTFPHIASVTVSFLEKPEVWFSVRVLKTLQMMEIPGLKSWIHHLVMDGLTQALVDPGKIDIKVESTGPTNIPAKARARANAQGLLTVTLRGEETKGGVFVEDTRYCQLRVGDQREHTRHMQTPGAWQDHCSFLIEDLKVQKLRIKSKTKVLLSTYTLAQFEVSLADFPFEHRQCCQTSLEEKSPKSGGPIRLEADLEYTALPSIDDLTERGKGQPQQSDGTVSGVMYVCMHSANNLLGLDRNGFSDPYCILYSNGKKVKTTHYINRTKNPKWEVSVEFTVADFTKTMLSFIVYDWDGSSASEDDFLGSTHILLTKDEPCVVRDSLTLGYNLLNVGQVDNTRLGSIVVTVVFRPVPSVAKSESDSVTNAVQRTPGRTKSLTNVFEEVDSSDPRFDTMLKGALNRTLGGKKKKKLSSLSDKKTPDTMGLGGLLSQGHGILELHIIQAKDLVAMDLNGFSDPYCDIKINGERKFTTSVKKKTLDPIWNEFVTLQLPKPGENLELIMWDKDAFFSKDFLGSLTFTLDDLKKYSQEEENDGWFQLHRIRKGQIQLKISVVLEEPQSEITEDPFPSPANSESADSGVPNSNPTTPRNPLDSQEAPLTTSPAVNNGSPAMVSTPKKNGKDRHRALSESQSSNLQNTGSPEAEFNSKDIGRLTIPMSKARQRQLDNLQRSASEQGVSDESAQISFLTDSSETNDKPPTSLSYRRPGVLGRAQSLDPMILAGRMSESISDDKYYGIQGQVLSIKGLHGNTSSLYCKIRFDGRNAELRRRKESQGKVIAKSKSVLGWSDAQFNLDFEVDPGQGVWRDGLLTFDVKTSHKNHLATKSFTLQEILSEHHEVTKWLSLDGKIQLEVTLRHSNLPIVDGKRRSFIQSLRSAKGMQKIKE